MRTTRSFFFHRAPNGAFAAARVCARAASFAVCTAACVAASGAQAANADGISVASIDVDTRQAILDCTFEVVSQLKASAPVATTFVSETASLNAPGRASTGGAFAARNDRGFASDAFASRSGFPAAASAAPPGASGAMPDARGTASGRGFETPGLNTGVFGRDARDTRFEAFRSPERAAQVRASARAAGTAFCVGDGQLATAAHVLEPLFGSRFEPPVVRDRKGRTYAIDRIVSYSSNEDFVVFTAAGLSLPIARPHNTTDEPQGSLYFAWRRADGDIAFDRADYQGRSTRSTFNHEGWIQFSPAPTHGASGAAVFDGSGRVVGLITARSSEQVDALAFAVPIERVLSASMEWARIDARDPMRVLGMASGLNPPLEGGIPLPAPYARFEQHMTDVRRTYFAHMLPYVLSLSGEQAPMGDEQRVALCSALEPEYCALPGSAVATPTSDRGTTVNTPASIRRGCEVAWSGVGAALVRCRTKPGVKAARMMNDVRAHLAAASHGRVAAQAPPAPCTNRDELQEAVAAGDFADHTGAKWQVRAWPVQGCDWVTVSMTRALPDGTLTFVNGAPSAYAEAAVIQLKALTSIQCDSCGRTPLTESVLAEVREARSEVPR
jgi:hypothetical protein